MSLAAQIIDQRVLKLVEELEERFTNELNLGSDAAKRSSVALVYLVARTILDISDDDAMEGIVDGGNDFGVDAIYFTPPIDGEIAITLIQGKYKKSLDGNSNFPENGITKMIDAISSLFDPRKELTLNPRLKKRIEEIRSFVADGAIPRVTAVATNNGLEWNDIAQQHIGNSGKNFGDQVEWRYIGPDKILSFLQAQKPIDTTLQLTGKAVVEDFDFRRVLIGRMSVNELARLAESFGDRLLERNIRRYLGLSGNRVNEAVANTLRSPNERGNFYFYNNGVTITCSKFRHNNLQELSWPVQVDGLQIVNGGQTSKTVQQIVKEMGADIASAQILVRIYELPQNDDDLIRAITYATNSQNPVDLRDLKANDSLQKRLAESIGGLGYSYRTKREDNAVVSNEFTSAVVAEAVLAVWRHRPHQARFAGRAHFGALYEITFTDNLNGAQAVIAALLLRQAENRRKRPPADAPDFLAYGSRFIAMMMGRYLLDDMNISLDKLNHLNFNEAHRLVEGSGSDYIAKAESSIASVLDTLLSVDERKSLQRLSATFRRADLVEKLIGRPLSAAIGQQDR